MCFIVRFVEVIGIIDDYLSILNDKSLGKVICLFKIVICWLNLMGIMEGSFKCMFTYIRNYIINAAIHSTCMHRAHDLLVSYLIVYIKNA